MDYTNLTDDDIVINFINNYITFSGTDSKFGHELSIKDNQGVNISKNALRFINKIYNNKIYNNKIYDNNYNCDNEDESIFCSYKYKFNELVYDMISYMSNVDNKCFIDFFLQ